MVVIAVVNADPDPIPARGVIFSSWPARVNVAAVLFTWTWSTVMPLRSRSKRDRFWVAVAVTVTVPLRLCVAGT